jgi:hypothetical protein
MRLFRALLLSMLILLLLWMQPLQPASFGKFAFAQDTGEESEEERAPRTTTITVPFENHRWWLSRYSNNRIECSFIIEHEGLPTGDDIEALCTEKVYDEWLRSEPCSLAGVDSYNQCPGFYLQYIGTTPGERQIEIELPMPSVWVSIINCNPRPPDARCTRLPNLLLTAEEPLPNETIINVQGRIGNDVFSCMGSTCSVPLTPTGMDGITVEFWADSSFGDSTEHYTARVRLVPWGDFMNPERKSSDPVLWYVDILSDQWRDGELATCSDTWQVFPDLGGPPDWLASTSDEEDLRTDKSYYYLAGALITYGVVDASACLDGGLQAPNIASPCGVDVARPHLAEWQNRYDGEIIQVSRETGVPARLLKNVFSRESQIWPGIYTTYAEAGLGQLTDNGADTILLWNPDFFHQFCPLVLNKEYCKLGFGNLGESEQLMLRGALVRKVDASCPNCPAGIDISQANYSVRVFAEGMLANCAQVGRIIENLTQFSPGQTSTYEDLWRFTLINYNAGPGCLADSIRTAWIIHQRLNWTTVTAYLDPACQGAIGYVEDISRILKATPTPTAWIRFDDTIPTPVLPRVLMTPTPTVPFAQQSPTPTPPIPTVAIPTGYPIPGGSTPTPGTFPTEVYPYP